MWPSCLSDQNSRPCLCWEKSMATAALKLMLVGFLFWLEGHTLLGGPNLRETVLFILLFLAWFERGGDCCCQSRELRLLNVCSTHVCFHVPAAFWCCVLFLCDSRIMRSM